MVKRMLKFCAAVYAINQAAVRWPVNKFYDVFLEGCHDEPDRIATIPNFISLVRGMGLSLAAWHWQNSIPASLAILFVAGISDLIDGRFAERLGRTWSGSVIDPTCDKIFVIAFLLAHRQLLRRFVLPGTLALEIFIVAAPSFLGWLYRLDLHAIDFRSTIVGKTKLTLQCLALVALTLHSGTAASVLLLAAWPWALGSIWERIPDMRQALAAQKARV